MTPSRSNRITNIGELQLAVLDLLTHLGEGSVYDVLEQFPEKQTPRYTTVLTVLRNLEQKGLVAHKTQGRTYIFRPTQQAARVRGQVLADVLSRVFGGSPEDLLATLLDSDAVTPEVLSELRALIEDREAGDHEQ